LFIESGSRPIAEKWLGWMRGESPYAVVDLLTCFDGAPQNYDGSRGAIFLTHDYPTREKRRALVEEFRRNKYDLIAIVCSNEPVMTKWKWYVGGMVPAKIMVVNENADWFWLDRGRWATIRQFVSVRLGLSGSGAASMLLQAVALPFSLAYVAALTLYFHLRRRLT
jgi:hypothetical protein